MWSLNIRTWSRTRMSYPFGREWVYPLCSINTCFIPIPILYPYPVLTQGSPFTPSISGDHFIPICKAERGWAILRESNRCTPLLNPCHYYRESNRCTPLLNPCHYYTRTRFIPIPSFNPRLSFYPQMSGHHFIPELKKRTRTSYHSRREWVYPLCSTHTRFIPIHPVWPKALFYPFYIG